MSAPTRASAGMQRAGGTAALYIAVAYLAAIPCSVLLVNYPGAVDPIQKVILLRDNYASMYGLNERATHALYDAFFAREVTNRYYRGMADVSEVTASHDLGKLVASGALEARGAGRSAHYVASPALYELVVQHAELDPRWLGTPGKDVAQRDAVLMGLAKRLHATSPPDSE